MMISSISNVLKTEFSIEQNDFFNRFQVISSFDLRFSPMYRLAILNKLDLARARIFFLSISPIKTNKIEIYNIFCQTRPSVVDVNCFLMDRLVLLQFFVILLAVPLQLFIVSKWSYRNSEQIKPFHRYVSYWKKRFFLNGLDITASQDRSRKSFDISLQRHGLIGLLVLLLIFLFHLFLHFINKHGEKISNLPLSKFFIFENNMDILLVNLQSFCLSIDH